MASLPNVNDFDWLREQFVDKEYFQIAGGISFRKQLKHIGGNCWKAHINSYGRDGSKSHRRRQWHVPSYLILRCPKFEPFILFEIIIASNSIFKMNGSNFESSQNQICWHVSLSSSKIGQWISTKSGLLFFTNGYYDFSETLWKSDDEIISNSRWLNIDEYQTYPIMLDRLAFAKWWFPKSSRVRFQRDEKIVLEVHHGFHLL